MQRTLLIFSAILMLATVLAQSATQTKAEKKNEIRKLSKVIKGKTISCTAKSDPKKTEVLTIAEKNDKVNVWGKFKGAEVLEDLWQVSVGDTLMMQFTGPDPDEGSVVLLTATYNIEEEPAEPFHAEAVVYAETGPGDGSGELVTLECKLK